MPYVIDRGRMPQPWDKPLIFRAGDDGNHIEVEVQDAASIDYRATAYFGRKTTLGQALVEDTRETFVVLVEAALNAKIVNDTAPPQRITIAIDDMVFR